MADTSLTKKHVTFLLYIEQKFMFTYLIISRENHFHLQVMAHVCM